jgi:hypothetical protein
MFAPTALPEAPATRDLDVLEGEQLSDLRFRGLLAASDWAKLPPGVRRRFSKRLRDRATTIYTGHVTMCVMSRTGWLLAQALRVIGAPLPLTRQSGLPTVVSVTEEGVSGGQNWTRIYARKNGFPQVIHSTKRFSGPTGLEEYIGYGIRMALTLGVENGALVFSSTGYFVDIGRFGFALPGWLSPGRTVVTHREAAREQFLFTLDLTHPWLGTLIHQEALYTEVQACPAASF